MIIYDNYECNHANELRHGTEPTILQSLIAEESCMASEWAIFETLF